jgi:DNA-binding MarR family transcriptional regulator
MVNQKPSDRLRLLDQYIYELVRRFYINASSNGAGAELSGSELFACLLVGRKGRCTMSQLAEECGLAVSSMTGVVDRLIAKGCVRRGRDEKEDRRRVFVELDRKGEKIYRERLESEMEMIITMMESLKPQEQDALLGTLGKALGSLKTGPFREEGR